MLRAPWMVLVFALASCAGAPPERVGAEGMWYLSQFRLTSNGEERAPQGAPFTLLLTTEGEATGQVACNRWQGSYSLEQGQLFVDGASTTRARCLIGDTATAQLEPLFLTRLASGGHVRMQGDMLEVSFADGLLWRFERRAGPP